MARRTNTVGGGQRSVVSDRNDADPSALTPHPSPLTPRRRGVILLVVLAILSLFTLMLITYVMATAHHKLGYRMTSRIEQTGDPPDALLHRAVLQVIRGPRNPVSVMGAHSLLEDLNGNRTVRGQVSTIATATSTTPGIDATSIGRGQIVRLVQCSVLLNPNDLDPTDGFFNGRVLTFTDGPAGGRSTRIVGSGKNASNPGTIDFEVVAVDGLAATANPSFTNFIINGRPFSGTGFGFRLSAFGNDPNEVDMISMMPLDSRGQTRLLDAIHDDGSPDHLYALLPNHSSIAFHVNKGKLNPYTDPAGPGGANEDYDAADFQNMLLAVRIYNGSIAVVPLPSLHRPDLVNYWANKFGGTWQNIPPEIMRGCILRPLQIDHSQFTGSNPAFDPIIGPWDVDNDGDGVPDSIWVDLGMPVQTAPDGRRYKPLFAILCIDLDGKLNLNAHGNRTHMDYAQDANPNRFRGISGPFALLANQTAQPAQVPILRAGQGLGPPEVSLQHLFQISKIEYVNLLMGLSPPASSDYVDGRYGESQRNLMVGGKAYLPGPGMSRICDPLCWLSQFEYPQVTNAMTLGHTSAFYADPTVPSPLNPIVGPIRFGPFTGFGTPPDLDGDGMLALDLRGQPLYISYAGGTFDPAGWGELDDRVDNAYELDLSLNARYAGFSSQERFGKTPNLNVGADMNNKVSSLDAPFTAAELERLYRYYDVDAAGLPDRLLRLAPNTFGNPALNLPGHLNLRNLVTHASFDLPVPSMVFSSTDSLAAMSQLVGASGKMPPMFDGNITELLRAKLVAKGVTDGSQEMKDALRQLLWPELVMGVKMDLNRPLGNGRDDNGNGVVDEWEEVAAERSWSEAYQGLGPDFDLDNDGIAPSSLMTAKDRLARQLLARHLYVLMMLLKDDNLKIDYDGNPANNAFPGQNTIEVAYAIAQWAVNVVDFRDRDSIMTSFEFDIYPFADDDAALPGTWDVDDKVGTQTNPSPDDNLPAPSRRGIVWGVERPELLLTETIGLHDRRTDDTVAGTDNEKKTDDPDPNKQDNDFDQVKRPLGSLFLELFNPNSPLEPTPAELARVAGQQGVDLSKRAPRGAPVWRIVVTKIPDPTRPLDLDDPLNPPPANAIERAIYFVATTNPLPPNDALRQLNPSGNHRQYYMDSAQNPPLPAPILPNRYCVVGPSKNTRVGEKTPPADPPNASPGSTRRIVLNPNASPDAPQQVQVHNNFGAGPDEIPNNAVNTGDIKAPVAVVIDAPHRLSVSEPTGLNGDNPYPAPNDPVTGAYTTIEDRPFDYDRPDDYKTALTRDATTPNFRLVHLQRLADPLNAYDPNNNPYRTVDTAPVDLTAFNGETNSTPGPQAIEGGFASKPLNFGTRERGTPQPRRPIPTPNNIAQPNLWSQQFDNSVMTKDAMGVADATLTDNSHVFGFRLVHTLGYLNEVLGGYWTNGTAPIIEANSQQVAPAYPVANVNDYVGDPKTPFPWLTWNNRPFASTTELALVPAVRSSKLFDPTRFTLNSGANDYDPPAGGGSFNHLLNLFHSQGADGAPNLYRLLEYVQVPSKFVGTRAWFDPSQFFGPSATPHSFHPPFNYVSNFRDPGRINVNTIFDVEGRVWGGIMDSQAVNTALQNNVARSRQGYSGSLYQPNSTYPTIFVKPFRSYGGNTLVPIKEMRDPANPSSMGQEIHSTLLRPELMNPNKPLFEVSTGQPFNDPTRNPYFRYQDLGRLSNMLTTRSNVYAIWITVGYFEVKYRAPDQTHPDGYELTTELGTDTGEIQRHRAFYIFDRSIPVGFQRGENHNVEDGIVLQRFIE